MSWLRYLTLKTFRHHNPDWDITLYTSKQTELTKVWTDHNEQDFHSYKGPDYRERVSDLGIKIIELNDMPKHLTPSQVSNICKWEMLHVNGGLYADMDIVWLKPLDELYEKIKEHDIAIVFRKWFSIGFLGSSVGNTFFSDILAHCGGDTSMYQQYGIMSILRLLKTAIACDPNLWKNFIDKYKQYKIYNMPMVWFYPFTFHSMKQIFERSCPIPEETVGLHWYAGDPVAQKWNNKIIEGMTGSSTILRAINGLT